MNLTKPQLEFMGDAANRDGAYAVGASQHRMARALCDKGMLRADGVSLFRLTDAGRRELEIRKILAPPVVLPSVSFRDIHDIPEDEDMEDAVPRCADCSGCGFGCYECDDTGIDPETRWWLAREATRLWHRDIGRGVTTGTKDTYIGFAFESLREAKEAA